MRAERLLNIVEILRRNRHVVTAETLAEELGVTTRTVYRDVASLRAMGTPIRGERGIGYVLDPGFDVPPLMFSADELEALMLGARMVKARADDFTAGSADAAIAKILAVIPKDRQEWLVDAPLFALSFTKRIVDQVDLQPLRMAFREQRKIRVRYADANGRVTERVLWPLSLGFFDERRGLVAWCEIREDFRHFRTDRIEEFSVLADRYPGKRALHLARWRRQLATELATRREASSERA